MAKRPPLPIGPAKPRVPNLLMRVWDAPVRLFHWSAALLVVLSAVSARQGWMGTHRWSGLALLALLLFRLAWGVAGSETARFGRFVQAPAAVLAGLAGFTRREPDTAVTYPAPCGWAALVLLAALGAQVATGLLAGNAEAALWHRRLWGVLLVLVALHVAAVLAYAAFKRHDLVRPMVTGRKRLPATVRQPRFASPLLAAALLLLAAGVAWLVGRFV